jgi:PadR family transcriptional regulator PadR
MDAGGARALTQLRRGVLEYCVLALLLERPRYGFDLVRELGEADGLLTSEGTIYPLLSRLRREGSVTTSWQESDAGPPRKYYALTDDGRTALTRFTQDWTRFRDAVDGVLGWHDPARPPPPDRRRGDDAGGVGAWRSAEDDVQVDAKEEP